MISEQQQRQRMLFYLAGLLVATVLALISAIAHPELSWITVLLWVLGIFCAAMAAVVIWWMVWTWKQDHRK